MGWITSVPQSAIYLEVSDINLNVDNLESDSLLIVAANETTSSDVRLVDASLQTNYSDVREVIGALNTHITGSSVDVLVSDATTGQIAMISDLRGASVLNISIENSDAGNLLDAFEVAIRGNASAAFQTIASVASDYTTSLQWPLLGCGGDLTTLDSDTAYTLTMACGGLNAVRLKASCNSTTTTLSTYWGAR